mmetsp:Transcript_49318/g.121019  ORF Transcript_49318/g.121019 Transcript_49318/m.121019 type:complete len:114 (+) Transcript_49318:282-623(+)
MGKIFKAYLSGTRIYSCAACGAHLARSEDIISKLFQGRHGQAYLFDTVVNVSLGQKEDRVLYTGLHRVADISCNVCQNVLGWKYIEAMEPREKYKENKFIVERPKMAKEKGWQ